MRTKSIWVGFGVVASLVGTAIVVGLATSTSGVAAGTPKAVSLANADLTPEFKAGIRHVANSRGIATDSLVEVGAVGAGTARRSALVGVDANGVVQVSLSTGYGFTPFIAESKLFKSGRAMVVGEGFSGPPTAVRSVGIVGVVNATVDYVTITQANGAAVNASLGTGPDGEIAFFAFSSDATEQFPRLVRAYDSTGAIVGEYRSQAKALCSRARPNCLK